MNDDRLIEKIIQELSRIWGKMIEELKINKELNDKIWSEAMNNLKQIEFFSKSNRNRRRII